jgi:hypothetical protein
MSKHNAEDHSWHTQQYQKRNKSFKRTHYKELKTKTTWYDVFWEVLAWLLMIAILSCAVWLPAIGWVTK